ncbi:MAG: hypothetical protein IPK55_12525 [Streptococcus sp.]|nr:hypothetical protein [Streptococcus sp.]
MTSAEQCDPGNLVGGGGCSASCTWETGWTCTLIGNVSFCSGICGDG